MHTNTSKISFFNESTQPRHTGGAVCYGHFSVLHPGHFRYLEYAASRGIGLCVVVKGDKFLEENEKIEGYTENDRAQNLAALSYIDRVIVQSDILISELIIKLEPKVLILGKDYDQSTPDVIAEAIEATKSVNGEVQFHAGISQNVTTSLSNNPLENENKKEPEILKMSAQDRASRGQSS